MLVKIDSMGSVTVGRLELCLHRDIKELVYTDDTEYFEYIDYLSIALRLPKDTKHEWGRHTQYFLHMCAVRLWQKHIGRRPARADTEPDKRS